MKKRLAALFILLGVLALPLLRVQSTVASPSVEPCTESDLYCSATSADELPHMLENFPVPSIASPASKFASVEFKVKKTVTRTIKYAIATKGTVKTSESTFKTQVQQILDDQRGWTRLGVKFELGDNPEFTVVLAEASQVPTYGAPCDTEYNCNVGNFVVANEDRWLYATKPWNDAGGNAIDYRHLVINHELGHWLGHGHPGCSGPGGAAGVMQQQSIDLGGCKFNAWPLDSEIWSTRLSI